MGKQQQGKKGQWLPLQAAATSSNGSTESTQQQQKGINFAGDKSSQSNIDKLSIFH